MNGKRSQYCRLLVVLCTVCYFVSYITRINYGAVLLEIVKTEGISKVEASMAVTGSFITYGAGQLLSGWLGDRMKPERMIFSGLLISALMNVLVPSFPEPEYILIFWCINGFAQALMWPPMVRILSVSLDNEQYKKACVRVTWGSSVGTIVIYLFAPVCIMWRGWRSLFFLCAGIAFCFAFVWITGMKAVVNRLDIERKQDISQEQNRKMSEQKDGRSPFWTTGTVLLLAVIMLAIVMQGVLRDGITTWMPSYVSDTFHLSSSVSILSGVLLPIFSIICLELTSLLNRKVIRNELLCAGAVFAAGCFGTLLLAFLPAHSAGLSVILAALVTGCMYGVNVILVSMIPPYFRKSGKVSTISGLLNSCTYVGSALSSYGVAWVAEQKGWQMVLWLWAVAALIGTVLCLGSARRWRATVTKKLLL